MISKKTIFLFFGLFSLLISNFLIAQDKANLSKLRKEIFALIQQQEDSLQKFEKKRIEKLFGLSINNSKNKDSYKFSFNKGCVLRFYLNTSKGKVKLRLLQSNWMDENKKEIVLLEAVGYSQKEQLSFYDYPLCQRNDFELILESEYGNEAVAVAFVGQVLLMGDYFYFPKENKRIIINENDTIIQYDY